MLRRFRQKKALVFFGEYLEYLANWDIGFCEDREFSREFS